MEFDNKEYHIRDTFKTTSDALGLIREDELFSEPGTEFLYTTHGYTLLSAVVESVVKQPFEKYMQEQFNILGLKNTYLDENDPLVYNRARYYVRYYYSVAA